MKLRSIAGGKKPSEGRTKANQSPLGTKAQIMGLKICSNLEETLQANKSAISFYLKKFEKYLGYILLPEGTENIEQATEWIINHLNPTFLRNKQYNIYQQQKIIEYLISLKNTLISYVSDAGLFFDEITQGERILLPETKQGIKQIVDQINIIFNTDILNDQLSTFEKEIEEEILGSLDPILGSIMESLDKPQGVKNKKEYITWLIENTKISKIIGVEDISTLKNLKQIIDSLIEKILQQNNEQDQINLGNRLKYLLNYSNIETEISKLENLQKRYSDLIEFMSNIDPYGTLTQKLDTQNNMEALFNILKQHFGEKTYPEKYSQNIEKLLEAIVPTYVRENEIIDEETIKTLIFSHNAVDDKMAQIFTNDPSMIKVMFEKVKDKQAQKRIIMAALDATPIAFYKLLSNIKVFEIFIKNFDQETILEIMKHGLGLNGRYKSYVKKDQKYAILKALEILMQKDGSGEILTEIIADKNMQKQIKTQLQELLKYFRNGSLIEKINQELDIYNLGAQEMFSNSLVLGYLLKKLKNEEVLELLSDATKENPNIPAIILKNRGLFVMMITSLKGIENQTKFMKILIETPNEDGIHTNPAELINNTYIFEMFLVAFFSKQDILKQLLLRAIELSPFDLKDSLSSHLLIKYLDLKSIREIEKQINKKMKNIGEIL